MCSGGRGLLPYVSHLENRAEHSHQEFPGVPPGLCLGFTQNKKTTSLHLFFFSRSEYGR